MGDQMTEAALIEQLADNEHERWARWMQYFFSNCTPASGGALLIPADYVAALSRQIRTPYAQLTQREQQYDRDEVALILPIIRVYGAVYSAVYSAEQGRASSKNSSSSARSDGHSRAHATPAVSPHDGC